MSERKVRVGIDEEWMELMKRARDMGLTPQEISAYFSFQQILNRNEVSATVNRQPSTFAQATRTL